MSNKDTRPLDLSAALADHEKEAMLARFKHLNEIASKVESLLVEGGLTWDEWGGIVNLMNDNFQRATGRMTLMELKPRYDGTNGRGEAKGGGSERGGSGGDAPPSGGTASA